MSQGPKARDDAVPSLTNSGQRRVDAITTIRPAATRILVLRRSKRRTRRPLERRAESARADEAHPGSCRPGATPDRGSTAGHQPTFRAPTFLFQLVIRTVKDTHASQLIVSFDATERLRRIRRWRRGRSRGPPRHGRVAPCRHHTAPRARAAACHQAVGRGRAWMARVANLATIDRRTRSSHRSGRGGRDLRLLRPRTGWSSRLVLTQPRQRITPSAKNAGLIPGRRRGPGSRVPCAGRGRTRSAPPGRRKPCRSTPAGTTRTPCRRGRSAARSCP
jgi:hypothetical protein